MIKDILDFLDKKSEKAFEMAVQQLSTDRMKDGCLSQAVEYYKKNWNDALHPGIVAVACEAVGGTDEAALLMQVPMLFLTAAADIHDDILDRSRVKNGKATIFGKFGEETALLVGDMMLSKGFVALYASGKRIASQRMDAIVAAIDDAFVEVSQVHSAEIEFRRRSDLNPNEYFCLLEKKSSIIEAHARIGALVGNGKENEIENLTKYGRLLGTLMTLRDEFIDLFEPQELKDRLKSGCLPLPIIYAFENPATRKSIMKILSKKGISRKDADTIVDLAFENEEVNNLKYKMEDLSRKAFELTTGLRKQQSLQLLLKALLEHL